MTSCNREVRFSRARHIIGDPRGAFAFNAWGFLLLVISFAFLLVAAIGRALGAA